MVPFRRGLSALLVVGVLVLSPIILLEDGPAVSAREYSTASPWAHSVPEAEPQRGHSAPPTLAPAAERAAPPLVRPERSASGPATPWASGAEYAGLAGVASSVGVTIGVPDDLPPSTDLYYVALSVFDSAQSYDQVGLANDNGSWQVYYSASADCGSRPTTDWNALPLERGQSYRFEISVEAGGDVLYSAYANGTAMTWEETVHTGATSLDVEANLTCGATVVPGLTESEKIYTAALGNPPYNFRLSNSSLNGSAESEWIRLPGSSNTTTVVLSGSNVSVDNAPLTLGFATPRDNITIETATSPQVLRATVDVTVDTPGTPVGLSAFTSAPAWTLSATPASGNASFVAVVQIEVPAGLAPGTIVVEIQGSDTAGASNRIALVITALPGLNLSVRIQPSSGSLDANETATFFANATGGRPAYSYSWSSLPRDCSVANSTVESCRFAIPGEFTLLSGVSDTMGYALYRNVTVHVVGDPSLSAASASVQGSLGASLELSTTLEGGIGPFTVSWQGLPSGCLSINATDLRCVPTATGTFTVTELSTDSTGFRSVLLLSVTVVNAPAGPSLNLGTVGLVLVALGLVVLISAAAVVLVRRHRSR